MNYAEKVRQLRIRRGIANTRIDISAAAKQRAGEQQLHKLSKSQMRALSATIAQGRTSKDHLDALEHFFGPNGVKKREREGRGWLAKVSGETARLDAVRQDVERWLGAARSIIQQVEAPQQTADMVAEEMVSYYIQVLEAWATLNSA